MSAKGDLLVRVKPKWLEAAGVVNVGRTIDIRDGKPVVEGGEVLDDVTNVVWCVGFRHDLSWIDLPIFGEDGAPMHERGRRHERAGPVLHGAAVPVRGRVGRDPGGGPRRAVDREAARAAHAGAGARRVGRGLTGLVPRPRGTRSWPARRASGPVTGFPRGGCREHAPDERLATHAAPIDDVQQRHVWSAFPAAVIRKFGDDGAGGLAALIAYYGFFSLFPLMLVVVSVASSVLRNDPALQARIVDSAIAQFPIVGTQIRENVGSVAGSPLAIVIGIGAALWAGLAVVSSVKTAMDEIWDVPRRKRGSVHPARPPRVASSS